MKTVQLMTNGDQRNEDFSLGHYLKIQFAENFMSSSESLILPSQLDADSVKFFFSRTCSGSEKFFLLENRAYEALALFVNLFAAVKFVRTFFFIGRRGCKEANMVLCTNKMQL